MRDLILLRLVKFFLENPYREVYLRELAGELKLSPFAVKKYADMLINEGLINEERRANLRYFKANIGPFFRQLKKALNINVLMKSGLVDFLKDNVSNVSSIVLFGSMAKGEDSKESDVDILVIGKYKHVNLARFEETLGREIAVHLLSWADWGKKAKEDVAFYHEVIIYGTPLYGEAPVVPTVKWR